MTQQQLIHYGLAALTVIAVWLGWKVTMKLLKYLLFIVAFIALGFLIVSLL